MSRSSLLHEEPTILHVFRGRAKLWTRCGLRAVSFAKILTRAEARNPERWWRPDLPYSGAAICVRCAYRMGEKTPTFS